MGVAMTALKCSSGEAGEMAQQSQALAALPEDLGSVPSTHTSVEETASPSW